MKNFRLPIALAALGLLAGCSSMSDVSDAVDRPLAIGAGSEPHSRSYDADARATFYAAKAALDPLGFRFTGGGPSQGELRAVSQVSPGDDPGSSHQFTIKADFHGAVDGSGTEVTVQMTEVVEDDSEHRQGFGTEAPLRDTALYEAFFRGIQTALRSGPPQ